MKSYLIPTKKNNLIILSYGTNSLGEKDTAEEIATGIISTAAEMKTENNDE